MKVRIGIDVGGTFTDAVLIDNETYELLGCMKIPTTHDSASGVAEGIVAVIEQILKKHSINPSDVAFIAHGTTQATNALLEGDVCKVGIVGIGQGVEGAKVKADTIMNKIELAEGKFINTSNSFVDSSKLLEAQIGTSIMNLKESGCEVMVAAGAFSVDDPTLEKTIIEKSIEMGMPTTATYEISQLYGLKVRTRTSVINASILPKMIQTANMTSKSVIDAKIETPLMIMRCDGGVMGIEEVKKRPILTMLSGPAAGVAGALMYEKISNGIFLEVGGTSTDISAIKNGKVMIKYAQIGGNKTYLNSLDVRTVGIAGGSMVRLSGKTFDIGPRSAHIAGLEYCVFSKNEFDCDISFEKFSPKMGDPKDYLKIVCSKGEYSLTLTCVANYLNYITEGDYSFGNYKNIENVLNALAKEVGRDTKEIAEEIMTKAAEKNAIVVKNLLTDYDFDKSNVVLVAGGGGCCAVVPYLAKYMKMNYKVAKNAEVISPIGVALAMVRDTVERMVMNPTKDDILNIRQEAIHRAIKQGATPESVDVQIEVDAKRNILRAIAVGTTELRTKNLSAKKIAKDDILEYVAKNLKIDKDSLILQDMNEQLYFLRYLKAKSFFSFFSNKKHQSIVVDNEGVIRIQESGGKYYTLLGSEISNTLQEIVEEESVYGDANIVVPDIYLFINSRIYNYTGLSDLEQILSLAKTELAGINNNQVVNVLAVAKMG